MAQRGLGFAKWNSLIDQVQVQVLLKAQSVRNPERQRKADKMGQDQMFGMDDLEHRKWREPTWPVWTNSI